MTLRCICFLKVGKGWLYSSHVFLVGHVARAARRLATGSTARVRTRVSEEWRFPSLLCVQTGPEVHSVSYKMSAGVKATERRINHPTSSKCRGCVYVHPCILIPRGPSWPIMVSLCKNVQLALIDSPRIATGQNTMMMMISNLKLIDHKKLNSCDKLLFSY